MIVFTQDSNVEEYDFLSIAGLVEEYTILNFSRVHQNNVLYYFFWEK